MHIEPFGVEIWMNEWETKCEWNLAETCVESLTIDELLLLAGKNSADLSELLAMKMTYGAIEGSDRLRRAIAALYRGQSPENVIITIAYPDATADQVDELVTQKVEQALEGLAGVRAITARSVNGLATIAVRRAAGEKLQAVLDRVRIRIDGITDLRI